MCENFGAEGKFLRCPLCSKRGGGMKATSLRADTSCFIHLNPTYHNFLQSYLKYKDFQKNNNKKIKKEDGNEQRMSINSNSNSLELKKELLRDPEKKEDYEDRLYYDYHFLNDNFTGN